MTRVATIAVLAFAVGVAGCSRLGMDGGRSAAPLPASPTTPVAGGQLQPLTPAPGMVTSDPSMSGPQPGQIMGEPLGAPQPGMAAPGAMASVTPPAGATEVGRNDMLGGWKIASGSSNCMLFMTLTTWSGGYRANTRGCNDSTLAGIAAWDLSGKQVVLKDGTGATVAQLHGMGGERFNGQTVGGMPVSLSR